MLIYCICTQYLVGAPFALITGSIRHGMEVISLWQLVWKLKDHKCYSMFDLNSRPD